ncbi:MAG: hypothetical protein WA821_24215 [Anaerolineales bacterium]
MQVASTSTPFQWKSSVQAGLGRRLATALIFAAFLLQGFVAQTHMHPESGFVPSIVHFAGKAVHPTPIVPGNTDEAENCPLCQVIIHAGAYFPPIVLDVLVPHREDGFLPVLAERDMRSAYYGHREQPRGPPSL